MFVRDPDSETLDIAVCLDDSDVAFAMLRDVAKCLARRPRSVPSKWLYDDRGCELFDQITQQPEYYPARRELEILQTHAADIARVASVSTLVELGSGLSVKTRILAEGLDATGQLKRFVAFDISESSVRQGLAAMSRALPTIEVQGVVGDFQSHLDHLPQAGPRMVSLLGSTIGNLDEPARRTFLIDLAGELRAGEWLLLGVDLVKDESRLCSAYDDAAGVTAEFERNLLLRLNREIQADFDPSRFRYRVRWNSDLSQIEMSLESIGCQTVHLPMLREVIDLFDGESIATEVSVKFRRPDLEAELAECGFVSRGWWSDPGQDFALVLATREAS